MPVTKRKPRSGCPISTTMEIIGDAWTLVIIRDMINGKKRFADFLSSPEGITTSVLSTRLEQMMQNGLVEATRYQNRPQRYEYALTDRGRELLPILQAMCRWANHHYPKTWTPPSSFMRKKA